MTPTLCFNVTIVLSLLAVGLPHVSCDYFSSLSELEKLLDAEKSLIKHFEHAFNERLRGVNVIKKILDDIENQRKNSSVDSTTPVAMYKRLKSVISIINEASAVNVDDAQLNLLETLNSLPNIQDLEGAALGLSRLQDTYNMTTNDIASGVLQGTNYGSSLTARDCLVLGITLIEVDKFNNAIEWLMQAKVKYSQENFSSEAIENTSDLEGNEELIDQHIAIAFWKNGNCKTALKIASTLLEKDPSNQIAAQLKSDCERDLEKHRLLLLHKITEESANTMDNISELDELYKKACRGELEVRSEVRRQLRCRYVNNNVDYYRIAPFKLEEYYLDPLIVVYYDAIRSDEMSYIIANAEKELIVSEISDSIVDFDVRTSKTGSLNLENDNKLTDFKERIKDLTDLTLQSAEPLQIANYGIGGQYLPHFDFAEDPEDEVAMNDGNRILTTLFYLSDVELGGATVFPLLSILVPPIKGSLLVWWNLHKSGEQDFRTLHGSCPVIKGHKWITTEWFHEQYQRLHCDLTADDYKSKYHKDIYMNIQPLPVT